MGDVKAELRKRAIESVFKLHNSESLNEATKSLLLALWEFDDSLERTMGLIQQPQNLAILCGILELLSIFFEKHKEKGNSGVILNALFACLSANLNPSYPKIDAHNVVVIKYAAKVASLFPDTLKEHVQSGVTNPHLAAFALACVAWSRPNEELLKSVVPLVPSKLAATTVSYGVIVLMSTHKEFENCPSVKSVVALYRSISDKATMLFLAPVMIGIFLIRMGPSMLKDLSPLIGFLSKKLKENVETVPLFCYMLEQYLEIPDAVATIKQYSSRLMKLLLLSVSKCMPIETLGNPLEYVRTKIGDAFVNLLNQMSIKPFDTFFAPRIETKTWEVLLLVYYMINKMPLSYFAADSIDPLLRQLLPGFKTVTPVYELLVLICDFFVRNFQTRSALNFMVEALDKGSQEAADAILRLQLPFNFVFPRLSRVLAPGKSSELVVQTLKTYLQAHLPETGSCSAISDLDTPSSSDSNFDIPQIRSIAGLTDWTQTEEAAPTDETIFFCNLIVSLEQHPDLFSLLPLAASTLSPQFSQVLMKTYPTPNKHRYQLNALSSFGSALQVLDSRVISALGNTFLMILPGQAMLFLAMTVQRLPREMMLKSLTKAMPFVLADPDKASRMIALIAYAYPDASITFIDMLLATSPIKRRVFFVMKFSDTGEQVLSVIFRAIGYCSIFLDIVYFNDTFLPFATKFLNKYLTHESKSPELYNSALFCIKKLSYRVKCWQEEHIDHMFPFKDFLVQYVCSFYVDVGDTVANGLPDWRSQIANVPSILFALSALLPLRPMRISDRHEKSAELTAFFLQCVDNDDDFTSVFKAAKIFFATLLQCNPSLTVFMGISLPMFPALILHPHWKELCNLMLFVSSHWDKLNLQLNSDTLSRIITDIGVLIGYVLPLTVQPVVGKMAGEIIYALTSLQCLIRNQILSLPKSIRPTLMPIDKTEGEELTQSICSFLSKYFMASQVFDIILSLVDLLVDNKLAPIHYMGTAVSIKNLLKEKGSEEFRYDARIVSSLIRSLDGKDDEVINQYLEIFEILMSMRMFSVLSVFTVFNSSLSDSMFEGIVNHIVNVDGGVAQLLSMIAAALNEDEGENNEEFYLRAFPMTKSRISELDNETWSKLLIGITPRVESVDDPLFKILSGNESYETILDFGRFTAENRLLSLPLILAELPERPTPLFVELALAFSASSEESCSAFLEYACSALRSRVEYSAFPLMKQVFENMEFKDWGSVSEDLTGLLIQHMRVNSDVLDCCMAFVNKLEGESLEFFWSNLANISSAHMDKWTDTLSLLIEKCNVCFSSLVDIIPVLVVRSSCVGIMRKLATCLSISESTPDDELGEAIVRADEFKSAIPRFLSAFVEMLNEDAYVNQCSRIINNLCEVINDDNSFAVRAIINRMATGKCQDSNFASNMLLRLLK